MARGQQRQASRPEHRGAAEKFYSSAEAVKYDGSARMAQTQRHLADRALQLLELPAGTPALLLDCGCGTGYSGRALERGGHTWVGVDVSEHMLHAARAARPLNSHLVAADIGQGFGFRKGIFDGAISISAVQWLCHATRPDHVPAKRLRKFFVGLHAVLAAGARAVLQFYPEDPKHVDMMREAAIQAGFAGGLVVDYPWSERSKKLYFVLLKSKHVHAVANPSSSTRLQDNRFSSAKRRNLGGKGRNNGGRQEAPTPGKRNFASEAPSNSMPKKRRKKSNHGY